MDRQQVDVGVISPIMTQQAKQLQKQGLSIALFSPEKPEKEKVEDDVHAAGSLEELVAVLKQPRLIRIEIDSWKLLNSVMDRLCPLLDDEDLLIDDTPKLHQPRAA